MTSARLSLIVAAALLAYVTALHPCDRAPFNIIQDCARLVGQHDLQPAINFAERVTREFPDCVDSFQCAGIVAYTVGDLKSAITSFEKVWKCAV